jgi:hypothetical protein
VKLSRSTSKTARFLTLARAFSIFIVLVLIAAQSGLVTLQKSVPPKLMLAKFPSHKNSWPSSKNTLALAPLGSLRLVSETP